MQHSGDDDDDDNSIRIHLHAYITDMRPNNNKINNNNISSLVGSEMTVMLRPFLLQE
jgi:hypothetical protein